MATSRPAIRRFAGSSPAFSRSSMASLRIAPSSLAVDVRQIHNFCSG